MDYTIEVKNINKAKPALQQGAVMRCAVRMADYYERILKLALEAPSKTQFETFANQCEGIFNSIRIGTDSEGRKEMSNRLQKYDGMFTEYGKPIMDTFSGEEKHIA